MKGSQEEEVQQRPVPGVEEFIKEIKKVVKPEVAKELNQSIQQMLEEVLVPSEAETDLVYDALKYIW